MILQLANSKVVMGVQTQVPPQNASKFVEMQRIWAERLVMMGMSKVEMGKLVLS